QLGARANVIVPGPPQGQQHPAISGIHYKERLSSAASMSTSATPSSETSSRPTSSASHMTTSTVTTNPGSASGAQSATSSNYSDIIGSCRICRKNILANEKCHTCCNCSQFVCEDCSSYSSIDKHWICSFCRRRATQPAISLEALKELGLNRMPSVRRMTQRLNHNELRLAAAHRNQQADNASQEQKHVPGTATHLHSTSLTVHQQQHRHQQQDQQQKQTTTVSRLGRKENSPRRQQENELTFGAVHSLRDPSVAADKSEAISASSYDQQKHQQQQQQKLTKPVSGSGVVKVESQTRKKQATGDRSQQRVRVHKTLSQPLSGNTQTTQQQHIATDPSNAFDTGYSNSPSTVASGGPSSTSPSHYASSSLLRRPVQASRRASASAAIESSSIVTDSHSGSNDNNNGLPTDSPNYPADAYNVIEQSSPAAAVNLATQQQQQNYALYHPVSSSQSSQSYVQPQTQQQQYYNQQQQPQIQYAPSGQYHVPLEQAGNEASLMLHYQGMSDTLNYQQQQSINDRVPIARPSNIHDETTYHEQQYSPNVGQTIHASNMGQNIHEPIAYRGSELPNQTQHYHTQCHPDNRSNLERRTSISDSSLDNMRAIRAHLHAQLGGQQDSQHQQKPTCDERQQQTMEDLQYQQQQHQNSVMVNQQQMNQRKLSDVSQINNQQQQQVPNVPRSQRQASTYAKTGRSHHLRRSQSMKDEDDAHLKFGSRLDNSSSGPTHPFTYQPQPESQYQQQHQKTNEHLKAQQIASIITPSSRKRGQSNEQNANDEHHTDSSSDIDDAMKMISPTQDEIPIDYHFNTRCAPSGQQQPQLQCESVGSVSIPSVSVSEFSSNAVGHNSPRMIDSNKDGFSAARRASDYHQHQQQQSSAVNNNQQSNNFAEVQQQLHRRRSAAAGFSYQQNNGTEMINFVPTAYDNANNDSGMPSQMKLAAGAAQYLMPRRGSSGRMLPKIPGEQSRSLLDLPNTENHGGGSGGTLDLPNSSGAVRRASAPEGQNIRIIVDDIDGGGGGGSRASAYGRIGGGSAGGAVGDANNLFERVVLYRDETIDPNQRTPRGFGLQVTGGKLSPSDDKLYAYVTWTLPGGPADKMNIMPGDKVIEWDGRCLINLTYEQVTEIIDSSSNCAELIIKPLNRMNLSVGNYVHQHRRLSQQSEKELKTFASTWANGMQQQHHNHQLQLQYQHQQQPTSMSSTNTALSGLMSDVLNRKISVGGSQTSVHSYAGESGAINQPRLGTGRKLPRIPGQGGSVAASRQDLDALMHQPGTSFTSVSTSNLYTGPAPQYLSGAGGLLARQGPLASTQGHRASISGLTVDQAGGGQSVSATNLYQHPSDSWLTNGGVSRQMRSAAASAASSYSALTGDAPHFAISSYGSANMSTLVGAGGQYGNDVSNTAPPTANNISARFANAFGSITDQSASDSNNCGQILLQVSVNERRSELLVYIMCARDVPVNYYEQYYVKITILPQSNKFKACKTQPSSRLEWNETIIFQNFPIDNVQRMAFEVGIWRHEDQLTLSTTKPQPVCETLISIQTARDRNTDWWPLRSPIVSPRESDRRKSLNDLLDNLSRGRDLSIGGTQSVMSSAYTGSTTADMNLSNEQYRRSGSIAQVCYSSPSGGAQQQQQRQQQQQQQQWQQHHQQSPTHFSIMANSRRRSSSNRHLPNQTVLNSATPRRASDEVCPSTSRLLSNRVSPQQSRRSISVIDVVENNKQAGSSRGSSARGSLGDTPSSSPKQNSIQHLDSLSQQSQKHQQQQHQACHSSGGGTPSSSNATNGTPESSVILPSCNVTRPSPRASIGSISASTVARIAAVAALTSERSSKINMAPGKGMHRGQSASISGPSVVPPSQPSATETPPANSNSSSRKSSFAMQTVRRLKRTMSLKSDKDEAINAIARDAQRSSDSRRSSNSTTTSSSEAPIDVAIVDRLNSRQDYVGEIKLSFIMTKGQLEIDVICARNLAHSTNDRSQQGPGWYKLRPMHILNNRSSRGSDEDFD
ncbi:Rab-3-interacting molecule unc-10, partial [Fragariocoptes setiger]